MAFVELEPLERDTYQLAYITQTLWNINRDTKKHPEALPISDFVLNFDPEEKKPKVEPKKQTVAEMEMLITDWCFVQNASLGQKTGSLKP